MTGEVTAHMTGYKAYKEREEMTTLSKQTRRSTVLCVDCGEPPELHRTRKGRPRRCTKKMPVLNSTARDSTFFVLRDGCSWA